MVYVWSILITLSIQKIYTCVLFEIRLNEHNLKGEIKSVENILLINKQEIWIHWQFIIDNLLMIMGKTLEKFRTSSHSLNIEKVRHNDINRRDFVLCITILI